MKLMNRRKRPHRERNFWWIESLRVVSALDDHIFDLEEEIIRLKRRRNEIRTKMAEFKAGP